MEMVEVRTRIGLKGFSYLESRPSITSNGSGKSWDLVAIMGALAAIVAVWKQLAANGGETLPIWGFADLGWCLERSSTKMGDNTWVKGGSGYVWCGSHILVIGKVIFQTWR